MAIKVDCPRCKTPLHVPNEQAGGYVNCARCKGRLWVPKDATTDETPVEKVVVLSVANAPTEVVPIESRPLASLATPPIRGMPRIAAPPSPARANGSPSMGQTPAPLVPVRPSPPVPSKKVARFIKAESADSALQLAPDGKLPELRLEEDAAREKPEQSQRSINPLALAGLLTISVVLSLVLVLMDVDSPPVSGVEKKAAMRQRIRDYFFGSSVLDAGRLEPYQVLLREAQQAYSRGDYKVERQHYRRVLDMLRAERGTEEKGLTGSRSKNKELEEALLVLLSGG